MTDAQHDPLAPELVAIIFDHLCESLTEITHHVSAGVLYTDHEKELKKSLVCCSLACRQWRSLAEPYLNRTLAIRFTYANGLGEKTLGEVLEGLDANQSLLSCVHYLRLVMYHESEWSRRNLYEDYAHGCDPTQLLSFLHKFHRLKAVALVGIRFSPLTVESASQHNVPLLKPLQQFAVIQPQPFMPSAVNVTRMLSWLSDVEEVTIATHPLLHWVGRDELQEDEQGRNPIQMNTTSLRLPMNSRFIPYSMIRAIYASRTFKTGALRKLDLGVGRELLDELRTLLTPTAQSLRELRLDFNPFFDESLITLPYNFTSTNLIPISSLPCLQKLHLQFPLPTVLSHRSYWDVQYTIEQQLPSLPSLESVLLVFVDTTFLPGGSSGTNEERIDASLQLLMPSLMSMALVLGNISTFKSLKIIVKDDDGKTYGAPRAFQEQIRSLLSDMFERGLVQV
ncbi:hypothetical protein BC629DRAFT_27172 [Irpex lacteus]|nr:hypothetical protein BC629DRAFT_27172 [Irpex lacteus]